MRPSRPTTRARSPSCSTNIPAATASPFTPCARARPVPAALCRSTCSCRTPGPSLRRTSCRKRSRRVSARECLALRSTRISSRSRTPPPTKTRASTDRVLKRFRSFPQDKLLDFAGRRGRHRPEDDFPRNLEVRQILAAPVDIFRLGGAAAGLELHESTRRLAPFLVGPRHHRRQMGGGMLVERDLDFHRGNVLPAGNDDVLLAVLDLDVMARVPHGEVPGVHPPARERLGGRL